MTAPFYCVALAFYVLTVSQGSLLVGAIRLLVPSSHLDNFGTRGRRGASGFSQIYISRYVPLAPHNQKPTELDGGYLIDIGVMCERDSREPSHIVS